VHCRIIGLSPLYTAQAGHMIYVRSTLAGIGAVVAAGALYFVCRNCLFVRPDMDVHILDMPIWLANLVEPGFALQLLRVSRIAFPVLLIFAAGFYLEFRRVPAR
jgi:hypothetical protein